MTKWNGEGGYIFISHSHLDIDKVRRIRNKFEEEGFEPLCFYLKCLNDDDEIDDLIKREIDSRNWFVFADSPNSRSSDWVRREREYVESRNKQVIHIDLQNDDVESCASKIMNSMRVFISYSHTNTKIAEAVRNTLAARDLRVLWDCDEDEEISWVENIVKKIRETSERGIFVPIITQDYAKSINCIKELHYANYLNAVMMPLIAGIDEKAMSPELHMILDRFRHIIISPDPTEDELNAVADAVMDELIKKYSMKGK